MSNSRRNQTNNNKKHKRKSPAEIRAKGLSNSSASSTRVIRFAPDPFKDMNDDAEDEETFKDMYGDDVESDFIITLTGLNQLDTLGKYNMALMRFGDEDIK